MKYKKLRIEDSLNATKSAIEEGVVSGGGQTLIEISDDLLNLSQTSSDDLRTGINICLLYTSPSPRDRTRSRMPSSA